MRCVPESTGCIDKTNEGERFHIISSAVALCCTCTSMADDSYQVNRPSPSKYIYWRRAWLLELLLNMNRVEVAIRTDRGEYVGGDTIYGYVWLKKVDVALIVNALFL